MSQALINRAKTALLVAAQAGDTLRFKWWQGYAKGLLDASSTHNSALEIKDQSLGGYKPAAYLQAAWACLPENVQHLSFGDVQQLLNANGIECTRDSIADLDIDAAKQLKNSVVTTVDLNDEVTQQVIHKTDNTSLHTHTPSNNENTSPILANGKDA